MAGEEFEAALAKFKAQCDAEKKEVISAGGLYIIGTERHESRRIDNQLRGRSGRQGDPGESRFYLSLEDNLLRIFNGEKIQKAMTFLKIDENEPIEAKMVTSQIESAQRKVEGHHFDIRKNLFDYDNVMNIQRNAIYQMRRDVLDGKDINQLVLEMLADITTNMLDSFLPEGAPDLKSPALTSDEAYVDGVRPFLVARGLVPDAEIVAKALGMIRERARTFLEDAEAMDYFFRETRVMDEKASTKLLVKEAEPVLRGLASAIEAVSPFDTVAIEAAMQAFLTEKGLEIKNVAQPARVALTGRSASPGLYEVMELLGKKASVARLVAGADICKSRA